MPYLDQLYIYVYCRVANRLKGEAETRVRDACVKIGGEYHCDDIYQVVALGKSVRRVALDRFYNEGSLYVLRSKFYKEMHRRLFK